FFSSRRRHTRSKRDWSSDVCSSDLIRAWKASTPNPWAGRVSTESALTADPAAVETPAGPRRPGGALTRRLARRLAQALVVLLATFTVTFILLQVMPGDSLMIRFEHPQLGLSPEELAHLREAYGADRPVILQFFTTLGAFLTGDFGYSIATGTPVSELLIDALPGTAALAGTAFLVAVLLAGVITLIGATR